MDDSAFRQCGNDGRGIDEGANVLSDEYARDEEEKSSCVGGAAPHTTTTVAPSLLTAFRKTLVITKTRNGQTCLHLAARRGFWKICKLLVSPSQLLCGGSCGSCSVATAGTACCALLQELMHARDSNDQLPIFLACREDHRSCVEVLLNGGYPLFGVNGFGLSLAQQAVVDDSPAVLAMVLGRMARREGAAGARGRLHDVPATVSQQDHSVDSVSQQEVKTVVGDEPTRVAAGGLGDEEPTGGVRTVVSAMTDHAGAPSEPDDRSLQDRPPPPRRRRSILEGPIEGVEARGMGLAALAVALGRTHLLEMLGEGGDQQIGIGGESAGVSGKNHVVEQHL